MESMGLRLWGRMEGLGLEGAMDASTEGPGSVVGVCNSEPGEGGGTMGSRLGR